ncbi:17536_t:CDS:2 [Cetraspora pellucida]|uniref:17536_t:CDS:1 n=1 Tax=Cetraspora pellucida TaxID=1433469 RepID=A0A9N9IFG5_9GLOM|nr:17536_t:CDS:2 [Cetraspora pellucida]
MNQMQQLKQILYTEEKKLKSLQKQAEYKHNSGISPNLQISLLIVLERNLKVKVKYPKNKLLQEQQLFVKYDKPELNLGLQKIKVVKIRTVNHLVNNVRNIHDEYVGRFTINNYLQPSHSNSIVAKTYCYPANIMVLSDDKAKVSLGITAIRKNLEFYKQLVSHPNDTNVILHNSQLSIFIHPQYGVGTSSATHMQDLDLLEKTAIWMNIVKYATMFQAFDLDYLTIQTQSSDQSKYNLVKWDIVSLSQKLTGIILSVNIYDPLFGKLIIVEYIKRNNFPFSIKFPRSEDENNMSWKWLETHARICNYFLDIKKCENILCYLPKQCKEIASLLMKNDGFLPPVMMGKDGYYVNLIHLLEFFNKDKIPEYDAYCLSIGKANYA